MNKKIKGIILRYFILIILTIGIIFLLDVFLVLLTTKFSYFFISWFFKSILSGNLIVAEGFIIEISSACVGLSAYVLLIALNLGTGMKFDKRIFSLIFSLVLFFVLNVLRILFLTFILVKNPAIFEVLHKILWVGFSSLIVAGIWILCVFIFKIKKIPIWDDFKLLYQARNRSNNSEGNQSN